MSKTRKTWAFGISCLLHLTLALGLILTFRFLYSKQPTEKSASISIETAIFQPSQVQEKASPQKSIRARAMPEAAKVKVAQAKAAQETAQDLGQAQPAQSQAIRENSVLPGGKTTGQDEQTYVALLRRQILAQERYPLEARRRKLEGIVEIEFELSEQGSLLQLKADSPSSPNLLKEAAIEAVRQAAPFPAPPVGISKKFRIPIGFHLNSH